MGRIESSQTQTVIEKLLQDLPESTPKQIWIGGRRSTDDKLRYINGTEFNKQCMYLNMKLTNLLIV